MLDLPLRHAEHKEALVADTTIQRLIRMEAKMDVILAQLSLVSVQEDVMSVELDALTAQVAAQTTVEKSAITLLNGLSKQIADLAAAGGTPAQFTALAATLKTSADDLGTAIVANTPATP